MKKNAAPTITHTEILCYAISHLDARIQEINSKAEGRPEGHPMHELCRNVAAPLMEKREILRQLYRIENGTDYES